MKSTLTARTTLPPGIAKVLQRLQCPPEVVLLRLQWRVAGSLSLRDIEEMLAEPDIGVDHKTVHRRVIMLVLLFLFNR